MGDPFANQLFDIMIEDNLLSRTENKEDHDQMLYLYQARLQNRKEREEAWGTGLGWWWEGTYMVLT